MNATIARQRFGKHRLKAGITTEAEFHLLGNGKLARVPDATGLTEFHGDG
jgi:hypothetical protein